MHDGRTLLLRPIRPEDEPMLSAAFHRLSPEAVRLRFFAPIKELTHETAAGLTQIDYDREMALVLADHDAPVPRSCMRSPASAPTPTRRRRSSRSPCATTSPGAGWGRCSCAA